MGWCHRVSSTVCFFGLNMDKTETPGGGMMKMQSGVIWNIPKAVSRLILQGLFWDLTENESANYFKITFQAKMQSDFKVLLKPWRTFEFLTDEQPLEDKLGLGLLILKHFIAIVSPKLQQSPSNDAKQWNPLSELLQSCDKLCSPAVLHTRHCVGSCIAFLHLVIDGRY